MATRSQARAISSVLVFTAFLWGGVGAPSLGFTAVTDSKWQACRSEPTKSCIAALAVEGTPDVSDQMFLIHLIHANHFRRDGSRYFPVQAFVPEMLNTLEGAQKKNAARPDIRLRLEKIENSFLENNEKHPTSHKLTELYQSTVDQILKGVPKIVAARESVQFSDPMPLVARKHVRERYGKGLDVFIQRWKELALHDHSVTFFGKAMLQLGQTEDARWAAQAAGEPFGGKTCRGADLWLELEEFANAEAAINATPCYRQRAELAQRYAQVGNVGLAKKVADELLKELPQQISELERTFDGDSLMETVRPLINALYLIGERDRAIQQIRQLEHLFKNRTLVSFAGRSFGPPDIAILLYDVGMEAEADRFVERMVKPIHSTSNEFSSAFLKCQLGKPNCFSDLMEFSDETLDYESAITLYTLALQTNDLNITPRHIEVVFKLNNAYRLMYFKMQRDLQSADEVETLRDINVILVEERQRTDVSQVLRLIFLLRVAVAMENRELAITIAQLILDREGPFEMRPGNIDTSASDFWSWKSKTANRARHLAETAAVFAQLP